MKTGFYCISIIMAVFWGSFLHADGGKEGAPLRTPSLTIDPKFRASDYQQIYEALRKEKSANKVYIQLVSGMTISNIIDMQLMSHNTIFLLRYNTPQGIKLQAVELESIQSIGYLE